MSPSPPKTATTTPFVTVVAPTPRTFTFPASHNLSDSPSPSPCATPEPAPRSPPRPSLDLIISLSPSSSLGSPSSISSPKLSKRRKSSLDVSERRPKKGDDDYVKRPENAFMLFRRHYVEDRLRTTDNGDGSKRPRQADLSKAISLEWKSLSARERQHWQQLAEQKKRQHEEKYPGYVYRPQRARDADGNVIKNKKRVKRSERGAQPETDVDNFTVVLPARMQRRSLSAPTPPLPCIVHFPNVYDNSSCPTSPSLVPLIKRRSSHPGHPEDIMMNFDYLPNEPSSAYPQEDCDSSQIQSVFLPGSYDDLDPSCSLLPPHEIVTTESSGFSRGSSSSGPSSPLAGPLTPTGISQSFAHLDTADYSSPVQQHCGSQQFDGQFDFISQGMNPSCQQLDYPVFVWGSSNSLAMWQNPSPGVMMSQDDFDIDAIPGAQLVVPQFDNSLSPTESQQYVEYPPTQYQEEGYLRYDEMINGF